MPRVRRSMSEPAVLDYRLGEFIKRFRQIYPCQAHLKETENAVVLYLIATWRKDLVHGVRAKQADDKLWDFQQSCPDCEKFVGFVLWLQAVYECTDGAWGAITNQKIRGAVVRVSKKR